MQALRWIVLIVISCWLMASCLLGLRADEPNPIGVQWRLTGMERDGHALALVAGSRITLMIDADGRARGNASINSYFGTAVVHADGAIAWPGAFGSTRMAGSPERMDEEMSYLDALPHTVRWRLDGGDLVLESADGRTRLTFSAR